ncbi:MAG: AMP-binding protein [Candidatus Pacebacteria bacterium]|nr:AMP-binding protein [Candidatus Paceibacterota bacterium]
MKPQNFHDLFLEISKRKNTDILFFEETKYRCIPWDISTFIHSVDIFRSYFKQNKIPTKSKIITCLPNNPKYVALFFACALEGVIIVPIDVQSQEDFIHNISKEITPHIYIGKSLQETISGCLCLAISDIEDSVRYNEQHPNINRFESCFEIVYTSGSTSKPKGVILTQENIFSNINSVIETKVIAKNSRFISVLPLSHMFEQTAGLFVPLVLGATIYYPYLKDPKHLISFSIDKEITSVVATPAFFALLYKESLNKESLIHKNCFKDFISGGAPLSENLKNYWETYGVHICEGYGMTEASPIITFNDSIFTDRGVGRPLPGLDIKIAESDNEILIKGPNISTGYFTKEGESNENIIDGWFKTGDLGYLDREGNLHITGRKKNMLVTQAGVKIHPEDIEKILLNNKNIRDVIVTLNDKQEYLIAIVLPIQGKKLEESTLKQEANTLLNDFQKIFEIHIWDLDDFVRLSNGKINRKGTIERYNKIKEGNNIQSDTKKITSLEEIINSITQIPIPLISDSSLLAYDLHIDSIKRLELISKLEQVYFVSLNESDIDHTTTVSRLRTLLSTKTKSLPIKTSYWQINPLSKYVRYLWLTFLTFILSYFEKIHIHQIEKLPDCPVIFIANHSSHLDGPTLLRALLPKRKKIVIIVAKDYFFKNSISSFLIRLCFNAIPVDRQGSIENSIKTIGSYIDKDYSVIIFPEGTRSTDGSLQDFKSGIGYIAKEMRIPVVPIYIQGTYTLLPKGKKLPKKGTVHLYLGKNIMFSEKETYESISKNLHTKIQELM